jgi:hypothetical protein
MRLARSLPRAVNPELNGHVSSTQRRRERRDKRRENQANQCLKTQRCRVSRMPLQQWARISRTPGEEVSPRPYVDLVFASLRLSLRSLRLCVEDVFSECR